MLKITPVYEFKEMNAKALEDEEFWNIFHSMRQELDMTSAIPVFIQYADTVPIQGGEIVFSGSKATGEVVYAHINFGVGLKEMPCLLSITMAHELGHLEDLMSVGGGNITTYDESLGEFDGEVSAWVNSIPLLVRHGFRNWRVLAYYAKTCLMDYAEESFDTGAERVDQIGRAMDQIQAQIEICKS